MEHPANLSGGLSYNNGPSLIQTPDGGFLVAWHSWRPPGREPFLPDGNIRNIWLATSGEGTSWSEPRMAFPEISRTEYASLARCGDRFSLCCYHVSRDRF